MVACPGTESSDEQQLQQHPCQWRERLLQRDWDTTITFCTQKLSASLVDTCCIFIQILNVYARSCVAAHCTDGATKSVVSVTSAIIMPTRQRLGCAVLPGLVARLPHGPALQGVLAAGAVLPLQPQTTPQGRGYGSVIYTDMM